MHLLYGFCDCGYSCLPPSTETHTHKEHSTPRNSSLASLYPLRSVCICADAGATCGDDGGSAASYAEKLAQVTMTLHAREEKILQLTKDLDDKQETHAMYAIHAIHAMCAMESLLCNLCVMMRLLHYSFFATGRVGDGRC